MCPEVSVVLPVRNAEATIERAVRSILNQSLQDLELIVVDDGSTDQTRTILSGIKDTRLQLVCTPAAGVAGAANTGMQQTQSPLIARMDADDVAHPQRLSSQLAFLEQHQLDVVGCQVEIHSTSGHLTDGMQRYQRWINEDTLHMEQVHALRFVELPLVNPSILARREYFELSFSNNRFPEDYDLLLRAIQLGMKAGKVPEVLLTWTDSPTRLTRTDDRYTVAAFMNCRQHYLRQGPLSDASQVRLWGAGQTGKPWLRWLQEQGFTVQSAVDVSPRKQGQTIHGVSVIAPNDLPPPDGTPLIVAVGADGARALITDFVTRRDYTPGHDVWFVA